MKLGIAVESSGRRMLLTHYLIRQRQSRPQLEVGIQHGRKCCKKPEILPDCHANFMRIIQHEWNLVGKILKLRVYATSSTNKAQQSPRFALASLSVSRQRPAEGRHWRD
jgi:hypothetical protein